jgi:hypothetical protein
MSGFARCNLIIVFAKDCVCVKAPNLSKARRALTQTKQLTQRGLMSANVPIEQYLTFNPNVLEHCTYDRLFNGL